MVPINVDEVVATSYIILKSLFASQTIIISRKVILSPSFFTDT